MQVSGRLARDLQHLVQVSGRLARDLQHIVQVSGRLARDLPHIVQVSGRLARDLPLYELRIKTTERTEHTEVLADSGFNLRI